MSIIRILKLSCAINILIALSACTTIPVEIVPKEPFEISFNITLDSADPTPLIGGNAGSLPVGKIFVIEHVNGYIRAPSGQKPIQFAVTLTPVYGAGGITHQLVPVFLGSDPNAPGQPDRYAVNQSVKWYASEYVSVLLVRTDSSWVMRGNVILTGYLIDD